MDFTIVSKTPSTLVSVIRNGVSIDLTITKQAKRVLKATNGSDIVGQGVSIKSAVADWYAKYDQATAPLQQAA